MRWIVDGTLAGWIVLAVFLLCLNAAHAAGPRPGDKAQVGQFCENLEDMTYLMEEVLLKQDMDRYEEIMMRDESVKCYDSRYFHNGARIVVTLVRFVGKYPRPDKENVDLQVWEFVAIDGEHGFAWFSVPVRGVRA